MRRQCTAFWHLPCHSYNRGGRAQVRQGASTRQRKKNGSWLGLSHAPRLLRTENSWGAYSLLCSPCSQLSAKRGYWIPGRDDRCYINVRDNIQGFLSYRIQGGSLFCHFLWREKELCTDGAEQTGHRGSFGRKGNLGHRGTGPLMCLLPSALQTASSHFRSRTSPCKAATVPWGTLSRHLPAPSLSPLRSRQRGAAERRGAASRRARSPARPCPRPHSPRTNPAAASSLSISARRPIPGARQQPEPGASVAAADLSPPGPLLRPRGALPAMSAPAEPGAARCRGTAALPRSAPAGARAEPLAGGYRGRSGAARRGAASSGVIETGAGAPSPWKPARSPGSPPRPAPGCPRALSARAARSRDGGGTAAGPGTAGSQPCSTARAAASSGSRLPRAALPAYPLLSPGARSFSLASANNGGCRCKKWPQGQQVTRAGEPLSGLSETGTRKQCGAPGGNWALLRSWRGGDGQSEVLSQSTRGCSTLSRGAEPWGQVCNGLSMYRENNLC